MEIWRDCNKPENAEINSIVEVVLHSWKPFLVSLSWRNSLHDSQGVRQPALRGPKISFGVSFQDYLLRAHCTSERLATSWSENCGMENPLLQLVLPDPDHPRHTFIATKCRSCALSTHWRSWRSHTALAGKPALFASKNSRVNRSQPVSQCSVHVTAKNW